MAGVENSMCEFYSAVERADKSAVEAMLKTGIDIEARNEDGLTALMIAVNREHLPIIKLLLEHGADIAARLHAGFDKYGYHQPDLTVLHYAVEFAKEENIVNSLLTVKPNFEPTSSEVFGRVVNFALQRGNSKILKYLFRDNDLNTLDSPIKELILVEEPAAIDLQDSYNGFSALLLAIKEKKLQSVKWLLQNGARFHKVSRYNDTIQWHSYESCSMLHMAVIWYTEHQDEELICLLNDYCGGIDEPTGCGLTPLDIAVRCYNFKLVKLLVKLGADINMNCNKYGQEDLTPLHSSIRGRESKIFKYFLESKKVSRKNLESVASFVIRRSFSANYAKLLSCWLIKDEYRRPENESVAFHLAIISHNQEVINFFFKCNSDVSDMKFHGVYPIHRAAEYNNIDCVIRLLDLGADINIKDEKLGYTALHYAVDKSHSSMVPLLLNNGVDMTAKSNSGHAAIDFAFKNFNNEIFEALLHAGASINFDTFEIDSSRFEYLSRIMSVHIIKLRTANLHIDPSYLRFLHFDSKDEEDKVTRTCMNEVDQLRMGKISDLSFVSYYHFLINDIRRLANYTKNTDITSRFDPDQVEDRFPIYGQMLVHSYRRAVKRSQKVQNTENLLCNILSNLPVELTCNIVNYLNDEDYKNLSFVKQ